MRTEISLNLGQHWRPVFASAVLAVFSLKTVLKGHATTEANETNDGELSARGATVTQRHFHRAEHWIVVRGTAEVTIEEASPVHENESIFIPIGTVHRLSNPDALHLNESACRPAAKTILFFSKTNIVEVDRPRVYS